MNDKTKTLLEIIEVLLDVIEKESKIMSIESHYKVEEARKKLADLFSTQLKPIA